MSWLDRLRALQEARRSLLCVGLDPDPERLPAALHPERDPVEAIYRFVSALIAATEEVVCAFKFNTAFYEAHGAAGWAALEALVSSVPPGPMVILDAKRADIPHSARFYAQALLGRMPRADAVTASPYMGLEALEPFWAYPDKAVFVLCRTSNPGAQTLQEKRLQAGHSLYQEVAAQVNAWARARSLNLGLVVGATEPEAIRNVRHKAPELPLLIPGIGAQGGALAEAVRYGTAGGGCVLINVSRSVLEAGSGPDFAEQARKQAETLRQLLWAHRSV
ncbi:MAG: orotidine-5'-phosphate decarboxylase [Bacteroidetes bacterium]|nr:orotidine-5'-phosphate decarboxylase [Rhodothermia bacterium]MCS7155969.1 orotidine-5'-phosphate decarboxylase [Bacteroidota bacterium]MCX7907657.1 orotidine-5'-phosphate decarboxylase [Bacteroidota bacterium]MDW8137786.1 orotidine-5'-phosphate decarboxylase [Bacteroidota bacterium]MDW8286363.1 orotidine-5'-phosphate decarboxylase [Bacteroidota bacterium]